MVRLALVFACAAASAAAVLAARAVSPASAEPPAAKGIAALSWLEGLWVSDGPQGRWETAYTSAVGGSMLSSMKLTAGGKERHFDFERWREVDGVVVMTPYPGGRASVDFTAVENDAAAKRIVLENLSHDFPKRFTYAAVEKDRLSITLEGEQGGKPSKMTFALTRRPPR